MFFRLVVLAPLPWVALLLCFGCGQREITYERPAPLTTHPVASSSSSDTISPSGSRDAGETDDKPPGVGGHPNGGAAPPSEPAGAGSGGSDGTTSSPDAACAFPNCGCFGHQDCPEGRFCYLNRCIVSRDCGDCRSTQSVCVISGDRAVCGSCEADVVYSCAQYLPERRVCEQGRCVCRRAEDCGYGGWCVDGHCAYSSTGVGTNGKDPPDRTGSETTTDSSDASSTSGAPDIDAGPDASLAPADAAALRDASESTSRPLF